MEQPINKQPRSPLRHLRDAKPPAPSACACGEPYPRLFARLEDPDLIGREILVECGFCYAPARLLIRSA